MCVCLFIYTSSYIFICQAHEHLVELLGDERVAAYVSATRTYWAQSLKWVKRTARRVRSALRMDKDKDKDKDSTTMMTMTMTNKRSGAFSRRPLQPQQQYHQVWQWPGFARMHNFLAERERVWHLVEGRRISFDTAAISLLVIVLIILRQIKFRRQRAAIDELR